MFHRPSGRDLLLMVGIAALNLVVTLLIGLLLNGLDHGSANPAFKSMGEADTATRVMAFAAMVPQLLGEELLTILPLLALLWWLHTRMRLARRTALVLAWLLSAIPFALAHLPTYQWDLVQCLVIIGSARWQLADEGVHHASDVGVLACITVEGLLRLGLGEGLCAQLVQLSLGNTADHLGASRRRRRGSAGGKAQHHGGSENLAFHARPPAILRATRVWASPS